MPRLALLLGLSLLSSAAALNTDVVALTQFKGSVAAMTFTAHVSKQGDPDVTIYEGAVQFNLSGQPQRIQEISSGGSDTSDVADRQDFAYQGPCLTRFQTSLVEPSGDVLSVDEAVTLAPNPCVSFSAEFDVPSYSTDLIGHLTSVPVIITRTDTLGARVTEIASCDRPRLTCTIRRFSEGGLLDGNQETTTVLFTEQLVLKQVKVTGQLDVYSSEQVTTFNERGWPVTSRETSSGGYFSSGTTIKTVSYAYSGIDDQGNWTRRVAQERDTHTGYTFTEDLTRVIQYR